MGERTRNKKIKMKEIPEEAKEAEVEVAMVFEDESEIADWIEEEVDDWLTRAISQEWSKFDKNLIWLSLIRLLSLIDEFPFELLVSFEILFSELKYFFE